MVTFLLIEKYFGFIYVFWTNLYTAYLYNDNGDINAWTRNVFFHRKTIYIYIYLFIF